MSTIPENGPIQFSVDHPAFNSATEEVRRAFVDSIQYAIDTGVMVITAEADWNTLGHSTSVELGYISTLMELVRERRTSRGTEAEIVRAYQRRGLTNPKQPSKP